MAKHEEHEEHENHERWLVSYADFITLLFAFFVVMYAISQTDQQRAIQVEQAVKFALHIKGEGGSDTALSLGGRSGQLVAPPATARSPDTAKEARRRRVQKKIAAATPAGRPAVLVLVEGQRLIVRMSAISLFDTGQSTLLPSAMPVLDAALQELVLLGDKVRVEGHTDADGSRTGPYDRNWALSATRAAAVVAYAEAIRVAPAARLALEAYGSTRPVADNGTADGRAQNRRIELVIDLSDKAVPADEEPKLDRH